MARLIPEIMIEQYAPEAERALLSEIARESTIGEGWVVLHSLKLCRHVTRMQGEADFLVMMPGVGFLVVEVKGCGVSRRDGVWTYEYDKPRRSSVGPFRQAEDAWRSLKKWLEANGFREEMRRMLFHSCVVFTELDFMESSPEWTSAEIINRSDLESQGIVCCLQNRMQLRHAAVSREKKIKADSFGWYDSTRSRPDYQLVMQISDRLRGDFSIRADSDAALRRQLEALDRVIENATRQQGAVALGAFRNPRVIVSGAAGTGKTYLATRLAREWTGEGLRVGLFCYNNLLGQQLRRELSDSPTRQPEYVGTFDAYLLWLLNERPPANTPPVYWSQLRERAVEAAMNNDRGPMFDVLLVDEAQDLVSPQCLDLFDLVLADGLSNGRWAMFGDFSRQAIYSGGASEDELFTLISKRAPDFFQFSLTTNCRNANRVAAGISILGGLDPAYQTVLNETIPGEVKPHFCVGEAEKQRKLLHLVNEQSRKYERRNVVILSSHRRGLAARTFGQDLPEEFSPLRLLSSGENLVRFGTIHAYKGLEAKSIIVTDCDWGDSANAALFYVAISRAEIEAHIILDEDQKESYRRRVLA